VFQISEDRALVATVDFFSPIVDDAYTFGAIAAANAFSDIYAMGARPIFALNLVAWPRKPEMLALLNETLRGGADVAQRAGALILGGHSIDDSEPKYGLVALGEVDPTKIVSNKGARPGDRLVLTKPIGTGILSTGLKRDLIDEAGIAEAASFMMTLNAAAMEAMLELGAATHACTDVTGFGLLGHLHNMLLASGHAGRIESADVPVLHGVRDLIAEGVVPGGTTRNREAAGKYVRWNDAVPEADRTLLADAQTSGGLLIAVDTARADALCAALEGRGVISAVIGKVVAGDAGQIEVV
jgi:selenide,water dikinase